MRSRGARAIGTPGSRLHPARPPVGEARPGRGGAASPDGGPAEDGAEALHALVDLGRAHAAVGEAQRALAALERRSRCPSRRRSPAAAASPKSSSADMPSGRVSQQKKPPAGGDAAGPSGMWRRPAIIASRRSRMSSVTRATLPGRWPPSMRRWIAASASRAGEMYVCEAAPASFAGDVRRRHEVAHPQPGGDRLREGRGEDHAARLGLLEQPRQVARPRSAACRTGRPRGSGCRARRPPRAAGGACRADRVAPDGFWKFGMV